jgi:DNA-binding transcriptional ArsR family regulator
MEFDKNRNFNNEADVYKMLGHPMRLKIIAGLCSRECNVKHIGECLGLAQATVSAHLALLKNKGIISGKRKGSEVHYRVIHPLAKQVIALMAQELSPVMKGHIREALFETH